MQNKFNINWILALVLGAAICSVLLLSLVPPVSRDALVHHLNVPKLYLENGKIYEIPNMPFSYYPMNLDLLYMIPLYFGNDIIPKFLHFAFALMTAFLIFNYLKRRINKTYALFGAAFFLSLPIIIKLSITAYVDLGLIFFSTASVLLLLKWVERGFRLRYLIFSAVFCGLAIGTKLNGLISCFLLTLFVLFLVSRYSTEKKPHFFKTIGFGVLFLLVTLLVFSPWMARNYHWKGNPVYPLYDKWFNPPSVTSMEIEANSSEKKVPIGLFGYRSFQYGETWWQIALLPVRVFFEGEDGRPKFFDGKLNPFLLFLPIFAFWRNREGNPNIRREKKVFLAFSGLFFAFAFFNAVLRIRYFSPILPPLVILSAFGLRNIVGGINHLKNARARKAMASVLAITLMLLFAFNASYVVDQFRYVKPFQYLSGQLSRDEYISQYCPEYPAMQYVNENLPPDSRLLFLFMGKRGYYCDRDYIPDTAGQLNRLFQLINNSNSQKQILREFKRMRITHLIIHINMFNKWINGLFTLEKRKLVMEFFTKSLVPLYSKNGVVVFELKGI